MAPKFGTSGLRGLVAELTDDLCARYLRAFLRASGTERGVLMLGGDLRPSTPRLMAAAAGAAADLGWQVVDCGALPTPALALAAARRGAAAVMVTGSHIPADRNGLKFYMPGGGEITKEDETAIVAGLEAEGAAPRPAAGAEGGSTGSDGGAALRSYAARYVDHYGPRALEGLRIGVYEHSSVARDLLHEVLAGLGAATRSLGRSDGFVPVDTEAVDPATRARLADWAAAGDLDAVVSTDGDADRPLVADGTGWVIPGDILGALTARALGAGAAVTPVSSNSMLEALVPAVRRTRIGSPYVIAGMEAARSASPRVAGFEANGGFLLGFEVPGAGGGAPLAPLPTRDALLPILAPLEAARAAGRSLAGLVADLPARRTAADRLEGVAPETGRALVADLAGSAPARAALFAEFGPEAHCDLTDGLRLRFASGLAVHLRPSGNAPELRCYAEAGTEAEAEAAMRATLARVAARLKTG